MAGQGSADLVAQDVVPAPNHDMADLGHVFRHTEGFTGWSVQKYLVDAEDDRVRYDFIYSFRTASDAMAALHDRPTLVFDGIEYRLSNAELLGSSTDLALIVPSGAGESSDISPPRKRVKREQPAEKKITCKICFSDLGESYSTPCRRCKGPTCYDCLAIHFRTAIKDFDRMPVKCCGSVMHHDVAKGVLQAAELEDYKLKYDERMNCVDPLYCPIPTCSTFIPPRMFKQNSTKVSCHVCNTTVCTECKQQAEEDHSCAQGDPVKLIVDKFHYKRCPRCKTGVMRMHGCPHIRCQCGAHWCWDCERPMNACYQKPCRAARDEGNYSDGGEEEVDSDDENTTTVMTLVDAPANAPVVTVPDTTIAHSELEHDVADTLVALRDAPVVHLEASAIATTVDNSDIAVSAAPTDPGTISAEISAQVLNEAAEVVVAPVHGASLIISDMDAPDTETITPEPATEATTAAANPVVETTVPLEQQVANSVPPVEQIEDHAENLDDPDEFDWEGRELDFGDEPNDETWDVWGCRHTFYNLSKDRIPRFWLKGIDPTTDPILEIECMGCFKKIKAWDDEAELHIFGIMRENSKNVAEFDVDALRQDWVKWKAETAGVDLNKDENATPLQSRIAATLKFAVECRHGCGVVYCTACKKASRKRMRKERVAGDVA